MDKTNYLQDLNEIKNIMNRSTRFMSLSGLSGILAGLYALIGAFLAKNILNNFLDSSKHRLLPKYGNLQTEFLVIAFVVAILSIITAYFLSKQKAKKQGVKIWDSTTKRLLFHFLVPLVTGGILSLQMIHFGFYGFIAPMTLIFYGLSIVNASKYTIGNVKYLGFAEIILGLIAMQYIGYGIYFWAIGFGVFHIIYGTIMYFTIEKEQI